MKEISSIRNKNQFLSVAAENYIDESKAPTLVQSITVDVNSDVKKHVSISFSNNDESYESRKEPQQLQQIYDQADKEPQQLQQIYDQADNKTVNDLSVTNDTKVVQK